MTGTIFAYGQTASGKTFTMMGEEPDHPGITLQACDHIFKYIQQVVNIDSCIVEATFCSVKVCRKHVSHFEKRLISGQLGTLVSQNSCLYVSHACFSLQHPEREHLIRASYLEIYNEVGTVSSQFSFLPCACTCAM